MSFLFELLLVGYAVLSVTHFFAVRYFVGLGKDPFLNYLVFVYFALTWPFLLVVFFIWKAKELLYD